MPLANDQSRQHIKKQRHFFANKGLSSQGYGFSSNHAWMWELDYKEKAEKWRIDAFELCRWRRLLSPLDFKEIQPVHPKGDLSWIFIGRTDAEAEAPILWPPDMKSWLIWKDPDTGKDWKQEGKGMTEDEMVGWHQQLRDMSLSKLWNLVMYKETWCATDHGVTKSQTRLSDWTELNWDTISILPVIFFNYWN